MTKTAVECTIVVVLLALCASPSEAQESRDVHIRNDCQLAAQIVVTGQPAGKSEWAMLVVRDCPGAASALARSFSEARGSADTTLLKRLTAPTDWLVDGRIVATALSIFQDRGASPQARVYAVRTLIWSLAPGDEIEYGHLVDVDRNGVWSCGGRGASFHGQVTQGDRLPRGWPARVDAVARAIHGDSSEPPSVRQAAACLVLTHPRPFMFP
jgi:hypothetical protein